MSGRLTSQADVAREDDEALHAQAAAGAQRGRTVGGQGLQPLQGGVDPVEAHQRWHAYELRLGLIGLGLGLGLGPRILRLEC
jgi:hypothetical protein